MHDSSNPAEPCTQSARTGLLLSNVLLRFIHQIPEDRVRLLVRTNVSASEFLLGFRSHDCLSHRLDEKAIL